jgi:hypothetical protein
VWKYLLLAFRLLSVLGGLILLYSAFFLYEDEHGKIQNRLENIWIRINDYRSAALSKHLGFMRLVSSSTARLLDNVFGKDLISVKFVGVSICFSFASLFLVKLWHKQGIVYENNRFLVVFIVVYLIMATLPRFISNRKSLKSWFLSIFLLIPITIVGLHVFIWNSKTLVGSINLYNEIDLATSILPGFVVGAAIASVCDILFIALTRHTLRLCSDLKSTIKILAILIVNACAVVSLFLVPLHYQGAFDVFTFDLWAETRGVGVTYMSAVGYFLYSNLIFMFEVAVYSNFYTSVVATLFFALAVLMLIHKVTWPVIDRPVYALQEIGIARRKRLFALLGAVLIALSFGHPIEILKFFLKLAS